MLKYTIVGAYYDGRPLFAHAYATSDAHVASVASVAYRDATAFPLRGHVEAASAKQPRWLHEDAQSMLDVPMSTPEHRDVLVHYLAWFAAPGP